MRLEFFAAALIAVSCGSAALAGSDTYSSPQPPTPLTTTATSSDTSRSTTTTTSTTTSDTGTTSTTTSESKAPQPQGKKEERGYMAYYVEILGGTNTVLSKMMAIAASGSPGAVQNVPASKLQPNCLVVTDGNRFMRIERKREQNEIVIYDLEKHKSLYVSDEAKTAYVVNPENQDLFRVPLFEEQIKRYVKSPWRSSKVGDKIFHEWKFSLKPASVEAKTDSKTGCPVNYKINCSLYPANLILTKISMIEPSELYFTVPISYAVLDQATQAAAKWTLPLCGPYDQKTLTRLPAMTLPKVTNQPSNVRHDPGFQKTLSGLNGFEFVYCLVGDAASEKSMDNKWRPKYAILYKPVGHTISLMGFSEFNSAIFATARRKHPQDFASSGIFAMQPDKSLLRIPLLKEQVAGLLEYLKFGYFDMDHARAEWAQSAFKDLIAPKLKTVNF